MAKITLKAQRFNKEKFNETVNKAKAVLNAAEIVMGNVQ